LLSAGVITKALIYSCILQGLFSKIIKSGCVSSMFKVKGRDRRKRRKTVRAVLGLVCRGYN
jgi:hypothetical protein